MNHRNPFTNSNWFSRVKFRFLSVYSHSERVYATYAKTPKVFEITFTTVSKEYSVFIIVLIDTAKKHRYETVANEDPIRESILDFHFPNKMK